MHFYSRAFDSHFELFVVASLKAFHWRALFTLGLRYLSTSQLQGLLLSAPGEAGDCYFYCLRTGFVCVSSMPRQHGHPETMVGIVDCILYLKLKKPVLQQC